MWLLRNIPPALPSIGSRADFADERAYSFHAGIDLYCPEGTQVQAAEAGVVVLVDIFTGPNASPPSPHWNETFSILIEGESGCLGYCELLPNPNIHFGTIVQPGTLLGTVTPVLKKDKGNGTTMLHFEHYRHGTREHIDWFKDQSQPAHLLNPRPFLEKLLETK